MIHRSLREWDHLAVSETGGDVAISRVAADSLIAAALAFGMGGPEGQAVLVDRHKHLQAQQVVGVLASPMATLEILPKIDALDEGATRQNLVHMLATVLDLELAGGADTDLGLQRHDLLEIVVRLFCDRLFDAVRRGLPRRYVDQSFDLAVLRGRLDAQRQFTVLAASPQKLACRYQELSHDIALNQIMKAAVTRLLRISRSSENQRRLTELAFSFTEVGLVPINQLPWARVVLDRTNTAWATLFGFARLLLGRRYQTTSIGDTRGFSLMFEMNTLFEEYIGRMVQLALIGSGLNVRLQSPRDHILSEEDGTRRFATCPDIVVSKGQTPILIIDTKWKRLTGVVDDPRRGVGQADVYQMLAYSVVYRCDRVMLLYPHHNELGSHEGKLATYQFRDANGAKLSVASISLSNLAGMRERLGKLIAGEVGPSLSSAPLVAR